MNHADFTHFVFVDFENVPKVDLRLIEGRPVHVTLLIGKNQGKVDFELVNQIHRLSAQVQLVKLDSSGHNALDLTVAFYLGRAVERTPAAQFCIVSRDKDFEPMIAHASGEAIQVVRCDSFETLPFLPRPKKATPAKAAAAAKPSAPAKPAGPPPAEPPDDRLEKLITRLKNNTAPRPKKKSSLLAHINTAFGNKLTDAEQAQLLAMLVTRSVLRIEAKERVAYG